MTNKEAIEQLKDMQSRCTNGYDVEVINIAIKALEDVDESYDDGYALGYSVGYVDGLCESEGIDD